MMGTILRVNLTSGRITQESAEPYAEWVGGIGVAQKILYDEVKPWMGPYDPGNRFILATGALSGMLCPGGGRTAAVTKSPMTMGIASGNVGGSFAPKMKYTGFDYIVFEGRSLKPVYLYIKNGEAKLYPADDLRGFPVKETVDYLEQEHGTDISTLCIGPAGENLVRYACVTCDRHRVIGKCGFGAVMGSKNLKAVVADGTAGSVKPADAMGLMKIVDDLYGRVDHNPNYEHLMENGTLSHIPGKYLTGGFNYRHNEDLNIPEKMAEAYAPNRIKERYRLHQSACAGCFIGCQNHHRIKEGPYAGLTMGGAPFNSVLNFGTKLDIYDYDFCAQATWMCNNLGMDMDVVAELLGWMMECFEKGIISSEELDGLEPRFGDQATALELIRKMAYREGVGALLAEGVARASTVLGTKESAYLGVHAKGNDLYEIIRSLIGYGFGAIVSTRGGSHVLGSPVCESSKFNEAEREVALRKFGVTTFNDATAYEGKAEIVTYYEGVTRACSCLGLCIFISDWQQIFMADIKDMAELLRCANGMELTEKELKDRMMAVLNLEKMFNYIHAGFTRKEDMPAERLFHEEVKSGPAKGIALDHERWDAMLSHYYEIHGWDTDTGIPTAETLKYYGLEDLIEDLDHPAQAPGRAYLR